MQRSNLVRRGALVTLGVIGLVLWLAAPSVVSGTAVEAGVHPDPPMPFDYPGGLADPRYQAAARRFRERSDVWFEREEEAAAAAEAASLGGTLSTLGLIILLVALGLSAREWIAHRSTISA